MKSPTAVPVGTFSETLLFESAMSVGASLTALTVSETVTVAELAEPSLAL